MKNIFILSACFIILFSCGKKNHVDETKKIFIVSDFNRKIQIRDQKALEENPQLVSLKIIQEYDYPKGSINFIFKQNGTIFLYKEEMFDIMCGTGMNEIEPIKRTLDKDSLKLIKYNQIENYLKSQSNIKNMKNGWGDMRPLSFSFENDTIKNFDVYKLLQNIDILGYHHYFVRRIAPFEQKALGNYK